MSRILINQADGSTVVSQLLLAESLMERMKGLLGRRSLPGDTGLLIRPCSSIHMWFMRFPIDAAFLDTELNVLEIARHLCPWQLGWAPRGTHSVLETAAGMLDNIHPGDRLSIREE